MTLRRHSTNSSNVNMNTNLDFPLTEGKNANHLSNTINNDELAFSTNALIPSTNSTTTDTVTITATKTNEQRNKSIMTIMSLMKSSCPSYFDLPRSTRKRILRFLIDNGWLDVS